MAPRLNSQILKRNGLVSLSPPYSRPVTSKTLQFRRVTDSVHHQKDKIIWAISFSIGNCLFLFQENLKAQRVFKQTEPNFSDLEDYVENV